MPQGDPSKPPERKGLNGVTQRNRLARANRANPPGPGTPLPCFPTCRTSTGPAPSMEVMAARNILRGDQAGRSKPESPLSGAEFAALLVHTLGLEQETAV